MLADASASTGAIICAPLISGLARHRRRPRRAHGSLPSVSSGRAGSAHEGVTYLLT